MKPRLAALVLGLAACGNPAPTPPSRPAEVAVARPPAPASGTVAPDAVLAPPDKPVAPPPPPAPAPPDRAPEVFAPPYKVVGVGQTIGFGLAAIDQDLDETRVTVLEKPASAAVDLLTQTVTWTPTRKDLPAGRFRIAVETLDAAGNAVATAEHTWEIAVSRKKQPLPVAPPADLVAETLLTIRQPARVAEVARRWPLERMLVRAAELLRATFPPEQQAALAKSQPLAGKAGKRAGRQLFDGLLASLAQTHGNPRLDPASPAFDRKTFGDPGAWKLVAVRPRVDKKWTELRLVYQAVRAHEPVFVMFRVRPTWDVPTLPPEAKAYNNKAFLGLVWKHLLDGGKPSETFWRKPKLHGKAVADLVDAVLAWDESSTQPWARAGFLALPTEARMGGGSRRNPDGSYRSGDAWAWSVTRPLVDASGTAQAYTAIGIPGFWTHTVPSADGTAWVGKCAPKFDPDHPDHAPGYEALCRKATGMVDLPAAVDGKVVSAKIDAANLWLDHKLGDARALLAIDDARRDHGEENGMTCAECHIRNFGVRDYADAATADPRAGLPKGPNRPLPTLNFQVTPTTTWEAYALEFMKDQECKAARQFEQYLGTPSGLGCPLLP